MRDKGKDSFAGRVKEHHGKKAASTNGVVLSTAKASSKKRTDIQALRALAVLAVLIYHLWPNRLTGGFMGVDIFFVISGYLMTTTIIKHMQPVITAKVGRLRAARTFLSDFYARRIKRLLPAASVTLIVILVVVLFSGQFYLQAQTAWQVLTSAIFGQNWQLASESVNYLAASESATAVQHFWSLSLEEQFYLIWPLFLLVCSVVTTSLVVLYKRTKVSFTIIPVILFTIAFFIIGYSLTKSNSSAAYFVTQARVWELSLGGIVALLPVIKNRDLQVLLPWMGVLMCLYAIFQLDGSNFPGWQALIPTVGAAIAIYGGGSGTKGLTLTRYSRYRPIQFIGDISYSLYLWHWPLIILLPVVIGFNFDNPYGKFIKVAIIIMSVVLAWLSYKFIEQPPQRINLKKSWIYVLFVILVGGIAFSGWRIAAGANKSLERGFVEVNNAVMDKDNKCLGARAIENNDLCGNQFGVINRGWAQYTKKSDGIINIRTGLKCPYYRPGEGDDYTQYCVIGDETSSKQILLWGDSHIDQWVNTFDEIGRRYNIKFILYSSGPCAADDITAVTCKDRLNFADERGFFNDSQALIVAFLAKDDAIRAMNVLKTLGSKTTKPIYVLQDIPLADKNNGPECYVTRRACSGDKITMLAMADKNLKFLLDAGLIDKNQIISTEDMFCDHDKCYSFIGGLSVYHNTDNVENSHISGIYAVTSAGVMEKSLREAGILE